MRQSDNDELVQDLERRIDALEQVDPDRLGAFTRMDWVLLTLFSVVIPVIVVVAAR